MDFNNFLKEKELKVTKARLGILDVLSNSKNSLTVEEILYNCKVKGLSINLSTVYRALEVFEEKNIVDKFSLKEGLCSYKLKGKEHKHTLECNICNRQIEVPCPMKHIEEVVQSETGFTLTDHNLVMKGVCKSCKKK